MITLYSECGVAHFKCDKFPDGTQKLNLYSRIKEIFWQYENDTELFTIMAIKRYMDDTYPNQKVNLVMPYIPNARMDRVENYSDIFTLKYFAEFINSLKFNHVFVLDAHSNVSLALLDRTSELDVECFIKAAIEACSAEDPELVLFYPDDGAMKRYNKNLSDLKVAYGKKVRDWNTGQITDFHIENSESVRNHNVLIIDDICSRGGTFYYSANALKECGAKDISLYVTHAEHTMVEGPMYNGDTIKKIFTTDSIFQTSWDWRRKVIILGVNEYEYEE